MMSDRAVEAAAQALYTLANRDMFVRDWGSLTEARRGGYRVMARAALEAAESTKGRGDERTSTAPLPVL